MIETPGAVPIVEPTQALALLVVLPLVWAVGCAAARRRAGAIAAACALLTLGVAISVAVTTWSVLARGHAGSIQHLATVARLGSLDLRVDLVADARSAMVCVVAAVLGLASVASELATMGPERARRLGWTGALTGGVVLAACGDGMGPTVAGAQLATLATFALAGESRIRAVLVATAGDGGLVLAGCVLFWVLGGTYGSSGYVDDQGPRAALVATTEDGSRSGVASDKAVLSVPTHGGAQITSDRDVPLPGEPLVAPFVAELDPGVVSFRIRLGPASPDVLATNVSLAARHTYVVVPLGPTTSLREVAERTRIDSSDAQPDVLAVRSLFGGRLDVVLAFAFALALVARLALCVAARAPLPALAITSLLAVDLAVRVQPLLGAASLVFALVVGVAGVLAAAVAVHRAADAPGAGTAQGAAIAAIAALGMVAAAAGEPGAALAIAFPGALGMAALGMTSGREGLRWALVGGGVSVALLPGAGASAGLVAAAAALVVRGLTSPLATALGAWLVLVALCTAVWLLAVAVRASASEAEPTSAAAVPPLRAGTLLVLALSAVALGPVLGVGAHSVPGSAPALADRLLATTVVWRRAHDVAASPPLFVVGLAFAVVTLPAVLGWAFAARNLRERAAASTAARAEGAVVRATDGLVAIVRALVEGVIVLDREVLDDLGSAVASSATRAARLVARFGVRAAGDADAPAPFDRVTAALLVRLGLDDPRVAARVRGVVVVLGVVIPVVVVLSSWLLA